MKCILKKQGYFLGRKLKYQIFSSSVDIILFTVEEITHDHLLEKITVFHSLNKEFFPKSNFFSLQKIKLLIELKFMEKSAKTVRWVLDKVIFLATCFE